MSHESLPKFTERLNTLAKSTDGHGQIIEINHIEDTDWEFPIRYTMHRNESDGTLLLVGRDLRSIAEVQQQLVKAQLALEKEYEKHRDFETRYRVLRDNLSEAMVFVDVSTGRVLDLNPRAAKLLNSNVDGLIGLSVTAVFEEPQKGSVLEILTKAATDTDPEPIKIRTARSKNAVTIRPIIFRSAGDMMILCRIEHATETAPATEELLASLSNLYHRGADAIVFTDARGTIRHANEGFLVLCDVVHTSELKGKMLSDYLSRGAIDQKVLLDNASQVGRLRMFSTKLKSAHGTEVAVEVAATHLNDHSESYFGFILRDTSRTEATLDAANRDEAMHNAMELVGTAPLKELVAATADVVEKMCIETAIDLTNNNPRRGGRVTGPLTPEFLCQAAQIQFIEEG